MGNKFRQIVTNPANIWFPFAISMGTALIYGCYLFLTNHYLVVNDFFGHVWMALEDIENGIGSSTNVVIPAGYPIILNILHSLGLDYMSASRLLTLLSFGFVLFFIWSSSSKAAETYWAGALAWLLTATSYHFLLTAATPLPDMAAFSMAIPLIMIGASPNRSRQSLFFAGILAGLSCNLRYNFLQSIVPLSIVFVLFVHPTPWKNRCRDALCIIAGLFIGLLPEIVFAFKAGHIPFQNASKYYLTLLTGETDFLMTATQLRQMPSTFDYIIQHKDIILPLWIKGYLRTTMVYILPPSALWGIAEVIAKLSHRVIFDYITRRRLTALLILNSLLLIPISLRQPLPYYFAPIPASIAFIAASIPLARLIAVNKTIMAFVIAIVVIASALQINSARSYLSLYKNSYLSFNNAVASALYDSGIRDSAEVFNLLNNPFDLYWPYGDKSPLPYYMIKEPGWFSLINTFPQKRPFIYAITPDILKRFKAVLSHPLPSHIQSAYLSDFKMVKQIGSIQVYIASRERH